MPEAARKHCRLDWPVEAGPLSVVHRELNELEYLNWSLGQPYNMVVVLEVHGELGVAALREALDKAQQRHPLLRVNTELGVDGIPWFSSEGVGPIPLDVRESAGEEAVQPLVQEELRRHFSMNVGADERLPLMRVTMLAPTSATALTRLVFTVQHVIGDGLSLAFLVRDLLAFLEHPEAPVQVLDAPASAEDLLPPEVRSAIPRSPLRFRVVLQAVKLYARVRFAGQRDAPPTHVQRHYAWTLSPEQTRRLRERCRREGVSVQSAICTAFSPAFTAVQVPVNLRERLARPVGESFGLFVGAAQVKLRLRPAAGFWANARAFHRRLRRALRDPFRVFRLFSKAVPLELIEQLGPLMVRVVAGTRPFSVTNLGELDGRRLQLRGEHFRVESFFGVVSAVVDANVLTVFTIDHRMRLRLIANEEGPDQTVLGDEGARAIDRLLAALDE